MCVCVCVSFDLMSKLYMFWGLGGVKLRGNGQDFKISFLFG